jgi:hypothetical protein
MPTASISVRNGHAQFHCQDPDECVCALLVLEGWRRVRLLIHEPENHPTAPPVRSMAETIAPHVSYAPWSYAPVVYVYAVRIYCVVCAARADAGSSSSVYIIALLMRDASQICCNPPQCFPEQVIAKPWSAISVLTYARGAGRYVLQQLSGSCQSVVYFYSTRVL